MIGMKANIIFAFIVYLCNFDLCGQELITKIISETVDKLDKKEFDKIYIKKNNYFTDRLPDSIDLFKLKIVTDEEIKNILDTLKLISIIEINVVDINANNIIINSAWYNFSRKRKKINKALLGNFILTYYYDCGELKYILKNKKSNFH